MLSSVAFYSPTRQPMIIYHYYQALAPQLPDKLGEMQPLFLAVIAMPVNFAKHSMTFTFREFSGETPSSRQMSSERGERCYLCWHIFFDSKAGARRWR